MMILANSVRAWGGPDFGDILKSEIEQLGADRLPLQQGLSAGSHVHGDKFSVRILGTSEEGNCIRARVGVFYNSIIAGCACADDPTPVNELNEYCEIRLDIDRKTAETKITLLTDEAKTEF
jgi:hypothetical protein